MLTCTDNEMDGVLADFNLFNKIVVPLANEDAHCQSLIKFEISSKVT